MNKTVTRVDRVQSPGEEIANSVSAGVGLIGAIAGIPLLLASTSQRGSIGLLQVRWSSLRTTLLLYLASTIYHALPRNRAKLPLPVNRSYGNLSVRV